MRNLDLHSLRKRVVEIDYLHKHRHLPGSLSALPIIASIYEHFDPACDVFILSKGHACAALYAVLEALGYQPDVSKVHPDRDPANGITITSGSLGHGLPIAVGIALAKQLAAISDQRSAISPEAESRKLTAESCPQGTVHVLLGDGECQEGTTWEALCLAARFGLEDILQVHVDLNGYQGSEALLAPIWPLAEIYPLQRWHTRRGEGVARFEKHPEKSVHLVTPEEFSEIMSEL